MDTNFSKYTLRLRSNIETSLRDRVRIQLGKTGKTIQLSLEKVVYLELKRSVKDEMAKQIHLELYDQQQKSSNEA